MKIFCTVTETEITNDAGYEVESVCAECPRCGHVTESFGTSGASIRRCLVLLRDECPRGESNFYEDEAAT